MVLFGYKINCTALFHLQKRELKAFLSTKGTNKQNGEKIGFLMIQFTAETL